MTAVGSVKVSDYSEAGEHEGKLKWWKQVGPGVYFNGYQYMM